MTKNKNELLIHILKEVDLDHYKWLNKDSNGRLVLSKYKNRFTIGKVSYVEYEEDDDVNDGKSEVDDSNYELCEVCDCEILLGVDEGGYSFYNKGGDDKPTLYQKPRYIYYCEECSNHWYPYIIDAEKKGEVFNDNTIPDGCDKYGDCVKCVKGVKNKI